MRVAVVGGGISGIAAATFLANRCDVTLFEAAPVLGGHAHTVTVDLDGERHHLDTGFMVFNERTYPTFMRLLDRWGVASQPSDMSFGVSCPVTGLEYAGTGLSGLLAQRSNAVRPWFWRMVADAVRFGRVGRRLLEGGDEDTTIGELLADRRWSTPFVEQYLVPLGAAIWSCSPETFEQFPARALAGFLDNHGLLTFADRPAWRTVVGGSSRYVEAATRDLGDAVRVATPVRAVVRDDDRVTVVTPTGPERFDQVVLAVHADLALELLVDASPAEKEVLGALPYSTNEVVLHHDRAMLPSEPRAWASWNYHRPSTPTGEVQVTYHLNRLQRIRSRHQFCVTLNRTDEIDPARVLWRATVQHPIYSAEGFAAHRRWQEISGRNRTHFCGAYWGWGFHEDGAASGERAAQAVLGPS